MFINWKTGKPRCLQTGNQIKTTLMGCRGGHVSCVYKRDSRKHSGLGVQPYALLKRRNPVYKHVGWLQSTGQYRSLTLSANQFNISGL